MVSPKKTQDHSFYKSQDLKKTWSFSLYNKYDTDKTAWTWNHLPFGDTKTSRSMWYKKPQRKIKGSILEIGSASGRAYDFIRNSHLVDHSDYTGLEISQQGIDTSKKKYPEANWLQADATIFKPKRHYDYLFERIAFHHMPDPVSVIDKFSKYIDKAISTTFVSCLNGDTISDLKLARYRHPNNNYVYFDIINVFEVIETLYKNGFNDISLYHGRLHEKVYSDPLALQYVSPEVSWKNRYVGRCVVFAQKKPELSSLKISTSYSWLARLNRPAVNLIEDRVRRMSGKRDGVLYDSPYNPVK